MSTEDARRLDDLAGAVNALTQRVDRLERALAGGAVVGSLTAPASGAPAHVTAPSRGSPFDLTLVGRSVLVLGGAYLLRAATELDAVPDVAGVALGITYAFALLALADRAAARHHTLDAALHGVTALLVAYPLTAELVLRFQLLDAQWGAVAVALVAAASIAVAARRRDEVLAWIAVGGALVTAVATAFAVQSLVPYIWMLVALVAAVEWLARRLDQRLLVWPPAIAAVLLLAAVIFAVLMHRPPPGAASIPALALVTFLVCAGGAMARSAVDRVDTTAAEMVLVSLAFVAGLGGGAAAAVASGWGLAYGLVVLALAAAGSVAALRMQSIPFWTSIWLAAGGVALALLLGGAALALVLVALGVALIVAGRRAHDTAELHGVLALVAAAAASGLTLTAWRGLAGAPPQALPGLAAPVALVALVAATWAVRDDGSRAAWATKLVALVAAFLHLAGTLAATAIVVLAASRPVAASLRTAVLSLGALAVAALARSPSARPAGILVYPILGLAVVKVVAEDLRAGTAATLTLGLACLGVALILAPKLSPRRPPAAA